MRSNSLRSFTHLLPSLSPNPSNHSNDANTNHRVANIQPITSVVSHPINPVNDTQSFQDKINSYSRDPLGQKRKLVWPPNWYTKCRILAVLELHEERLRQGLISDLHWRIWLPPMLSHLLPEDIETRDDGHVRFKRYRRLAEIKKNIKTWNRNLVKLQYVLNPKGERASGAGRKDDVPEDVKLSVYKSVCEIVQDPSALLYKSDVRNMLESRCRSRGMILFDSQSELTKYRKHRDRLRAQQNGI